MLRTRLRSQAPIAGATDLQRGLQLPSLSLLTLVVELEDHFRVCFEEGDEQQVQTIDDLVRLIDRRVRLLS